MKPKYGPRSRKVLGTLHVDLQIIFQAVLSLGYDHSLIEGHRDKETQNFYFDQGKSKIRWPKGRHNTVPSEAVDAMPWFTSLPHIDWKHEPSIHHFAGVVRGVAAMLYNMGEIKHRIRWGGDWDRDYNVREDQWDDLPHFELYKP
jgi:peptidoglycan LD-endopeptidase CwlK